MLTARAGVRATGGCSRHGRVFAARVSTRSPYPCAAQVSEPFVFVGPPFHAAYPRARHFSAAVLDHSSTPVLPYLEGHFSHLPYGRTTYPHMPFNHLDEEMVFVTLGTARLTFSSVPIQRVLPVDELPKNSKIYGRSQVPPAVRMQQVDAPAGTVAIYPARNNHTISSIGRTPTEYFVMRFYGRKIRARVVQSHETLDLARGQLSHTHVFPPAKSALAAMHTGTRMAMGSRARVASPVATSPQTEPMSDRIAVAGGESMQLHSTVLPVGTEHAAVHPKCDTVLLLLAGEARMEPPAKLLRKHSVAVIPSGVQYTLRNAADRPAAWYTARLCSPIE